MYGILMKISDMNILLVFSLFTTSHLFFDIFTVTPALILLY